MEATLSARSRKVTEWDQRMLRHIVRTGHQLTVMLGVLQRDQLHVYNPMEESGFGRCQGNGTCLTE